MIAPNIDSRDWIKALTPAVTARMNEEIEANKRAPYSFTCLPEQHYLTQSAWIADVKRWVAEAAALIAYYENKARVDASPAAP